jgi:DNA ligase-1
LSEKLDGARAFWNGQTMISKQGKMIACPSWFIEQLPKEIALDGELWLGRGNWELVMETLKSSENYLWENISFVTFDIPNSKDPFEIRARDLANIQFPKHVHVVNVEKCRGVDHLLEYFGNILESGGEGLMANKPESPYVQIRTDTLLKVKVIIIVVTYICPVTARF